jgi:SPW repeat-containing protein
MRFIPTRLHGIIDYLWGLSLLASPWVLGYADVPAARWLAVVFGAGAILYSMITVYELGLLRILPMRLHLIVDGVGGAFLAASPFLFGFADRVFWPHLAFGLFSVVASLITRTEPAQPLGGPFDCRNAQAGGP